MVDLALETIKLVHRLGLMITTCQVHALGVVQFPPQQRHKHLQAPAATINKVTVEEIRIIGRGSTIQFEDIVQIKVLAMRITANCQFPRKKNRKHSRKNVNYPSSGMDSSTSEGNCE